MTFDEIVSQVSINTGIPERIVERTYKSYWKVLRQHIVSLPLKEDLSDEEFLQLQPNVNIPSIGKLYVTLDRYKGMKKMHEIRNQINKNKDVTHNEY